MNPRGLHQRPESPCAYSEAVLVDSLSLALLSQVNQANSGYFRLAVFPWTTGGGSMFAVVLRRSHNPMQHPLVTD